ncbi:hypothetical protein MycrhDRAFT_3313 [Mycolicibacterium rhodesiae JS60]|nr:hypothetical protein MycrhDRAFT_3313 [Mycolicibacterium rhodesiae JS60]
MRLHVATVEGMRERLREFDWWPRALANLRELAARGGAAAEAQTIYVVAGNLRRFAVDADLTGE